MTGILGGKWELKNFSPMVDIPTAVKLASYSGDSIDISQTQLQNYIDLAECGQINVNMVKTFDFKTCQKDLTSWIPIN